MNDNALAFDHQLENSFYIKFYPGIKTSIGCGKATLILGRFEYWFTKYKNGFYKFIEPCSHPLYRTGDSWAEEIGFSRKVFTKAFDLIGVRYKSKSAFQKSQDKFRGKLYASYHDRKANQTYFFRNHEFANQVIRNFFMKKEKSAPPRPNKIKNHEPFIDELSRPKGRSRNLPTGRSSYIYIQRNTSSLRDNLAPQEPPTFDQDQQKVMEEMIAIWKEEVGEIGVFPSKHLLNRFNEAFVNFFDQSIESWKSYCQMISSSKFLMGEAQNKFFKKAWILWAITENAIERIRGGVFKLGDRQTTTDKKNNDLEFKIKTLEKEKKLIISYNEEINSIIKKERAQKIKKKTQSFSDEELVKAKLEFVEYLEKENNSISEEYQKNGWKGLFVEAYFEDFLKDKIESQIFTLSLEEETNQNIAKSGANEKLQDLSNKINILKEKMNDLRLIQ